MVYVSLFVISDFGRRIEAVGTKREAAANAIFASSKLCRESIGYSPSCTLKDLKYNV